MSSGDPRRLVGTEIVVPAGVMLFKQVTKAAGRPPPGRYEELGALAAPETFLVTAVVVPKGGNKGRMLLLRRPDLSMVLVEKTALEET